LISAFTTKFAKTSKTTRATSRTAPRRWGVASDGNTYLMLNAEIATIAGRHGSRRPSAGVESSHAGSWKRSGCLRLSIPAWLDLCRARRGDPWRIVRLTFTLRSRRSPSSNRFLR